MIESRNKIDKRNVADLIGLTAMQEGMLFHYLSNPGSKQYFEQFRFDLSGPVDPDIFKRAWSVTAQNNPMLRAVVRWERLEEPVQIVLKEKEIPVRFEDVFTSPDQQKRQIDSLVEDDRNTPLDLTLDPLRVTLCRLSDDESMMLISFHHILFDGWSTGIMLGEFLDNYNRIHDNPAAQSPILKKTPYKEFYKWYRGQDAEAMETFWKSCMEGFDTATTLPYDHRRLRDMHTVATCRVDISRETNAQLDTMTREHGLTFAGVLYTVWGILLQKYNNSDDVIFGTTVAGRPPQVKDVDSVVGLFINTLPLRFRGTGDMTGIDACRLVGGHLEERTQFEHTGLPSIKKFTGIGKDNNLFDSIFVIDNYPLDTLLNLDGTLRITAYSLFEMTNFDLTVQVVPGEDLGISFHYNPDVFDPHTVERMSRHFSNLLDSMVSEPRLNVNRMPMLCPEENHRILEEFNQPEILFVVDQTIHRVIENQAEHTPENQAVQFENRVLNYREFNALCNRWARMLQKCGVTRGSRVALMIPRSIEMIAGVIAILKAGAACIPLDIGYPDERNCFIIEDSGARFFLKTPEINLKHTGDVLDIDYETAAVQPFDDCNLDVEVEPKDLSYIIYTSGSTGKPKGALLHHSGVVNHTWTKINVLGIGETDTVANNFSVNVIAAVWQILSPLFTGARLVVYSDDVEWDPHLQFRRVAEDGVTVIEVIPSILKTYLFLLDEGKEKIDLDGLRRIALTSEETKPFLVNKFYGLYSVTRLVDCYGQTECCDDILHHTIPFDTETTVVPIGTPSLNTQVLVLNHHNQLQPVGIVGEICASGAGVGYGYWNRPELSAEKFVENPLDPGKPMYRTGDLGRWRPDGCVEFLGRIDHQVKIRGNRVELREIENRLIGFPEIIEAAVIAKEDKQSELNLYAFFHAERQLTASEIREYLLEQLPDYMVPVQFVQRDDLPLTPNGKIDRKALAKIKGSIATGAEYQPPRSDIEAQIEAIWRQLLDKEPIGVEDNFFDLGGHSLLLIKLKSKLEKAFNREIDIIELFNYPTVALQARFITGTFDAAQAHREDSGSAVAATGELDDIAIIGISIKVPGGDGIDQFWQLLENGKEAITFFTEKELEESGIDEFVRGTSRLVPARGIIGDVDMFDADFFGFNPREAEMTDPQQRLFLEYAWRALEDAGYCSDTYDGTIGVYAGVGMNTYLLNNVMANPEVVNTLGEFQTMIGNDKDFLSTRTAYKLGLSGPALTVQCACSTSLVALHLARRGLLDGDCRMALAGGVFLSIPEKNGYFYNEGGYLSPDGHCRAFSNDAEGTVFGNGVGLVVLKPLRAALEDNDHIYALLKGTAINNDGDYKVGYTSPSEIGQANVITAALRQARVHPETVGYVETHGTGTVLGDPVEIAALTRAYHSFGPAEKNESGAKEMKNQYCAIASVKSNIGHLDTAAGVVGLIKAVLALRNKKIPPTLNVDFPNPNIDFPRTPFYVVTEATPWPAPGPGIPRRAGVSSFGIGGTNAHAVLEEAPAPVANDTAVPAKDRLLVLSARTASALKESVNRLADHLKNAEEIKSGISLDDTAFTLATGRKAFDHRLAVVCKNTEDAVDVLENFYPKRILTQQRTEGEKSTVFMFSGVGEHYVDMAAQLYREEKRFRQEIDRCCDILKPILDEDLRDIIYPASTGNGSETVKDNHSSVNLRKLMGRGEEKLSPEAEKLNRTVYLQTAIFVIEYALARLLMSWGIQPYAMIGYSTGEYVAACISGVFSLEDALTIVAKRAQLIDGVEKGAMTAVSLPEDQLRPLVDNACASGSIAVAAVNTPDLCIVSGEPGGIETLESALKEQGHIFRRLKTFQAFHSPMMKAVRPQLEKLFENVSINAPTIPYMSNVTGTWASAREVTDSRYWITHTESSIRFSEGIRQLLDTSCNFFLEIGPGNSLCGFAAPHLRALKETGENENKVKTVRLVTASLPKESENIPARTFLLRTVGKCWIAGQAVDWNSFYRGEDCRRISLPTYPFERKRYWLDASRSAVTPASVSEGAGKTAVSSAAGIIRKKENIDDWFYAPVWKQSIPVFDAFAPGEEPEPSTWFLFTGENLLSRHLAERLRELGQDVVEVQMGQRFESFGDSEYKIHPGTYDHYVQLAEAMQQQGKTIDRIVHTWTWWGGEPDQASQPGIEPLEPGVIGLLHLVKALGHQYMFNMMELWVVSRGVFNVESNDESVPEHAALAGPIHVLSQEYPNITGRLVDIGPVTGNDSDIDASIRILVGSLIDEFFNSSRHRTIAYRGQRRWNLTYDKIKPPVLVSEDNADQLNLRPEGVYLITGGLGNIGLTLARFLARTVGARLILTSRSGFEPGAYDENDHRTVAIRQMEADGAEVLVIQADVADADRMVEVVETVEKRFGSINGVIHAAGVMMPEAFKLVSDLESDDCRLHFSPKIDGLRVLDQVLEGRTLDFCLLTSSLSPVLGGLSLYAYSAANGYMDGFARGRTRDARRWFSLNWADWQRDEPVGGGIDTVIGATVTALNISAAEGEETFKRALMLSRFMPQVIISSGDLHRRLQQWVLPEDDENDSRNGSVDASTVEVHQRPDLQTIYEAPGTEAEKIVAEIWQELLGLDMVGVHDNFFELGGHSLIATRLISRLREIFRIDIPLPTLFDRPTIREIVEHIIQTWGDPETVEEIAATYREVMQMN